MRNAAFLLVVPALTASASAQLELAPTIEETAMVSFTVAAKRMPTDGSGVEQHFFVMNPWG
jgi:hypothetical protein